MRAPRLVATWIVGLAALAGAGCNDFHYYDITVSFNINQSTGGYPQAEVATDERAGPAMPSPSQLPMPSASTPDSGIWTIEAMSM